MRAVSEECCCNDTTAATSLPSSTICRCWTTCPTLCAVSTGATDPRACNLAHWGCSTPGAYGVVTLPFSVREGINVFLAGFVPTENLRFRDSALTFKVSEIIEREEGAKRHASYTYPNMCKKLGDFELNVNVCCCHASGNMTIWPRRKARLRTRRSL